MNDRIKELAKLAQERAEWMTPQGLEWFDNFKEQFTLLIVRECVAICKDIDGEDNIDARSGRQDCAVEIKEHFGVEE